MCALILSYHVVQVPHASLPAQSLITIYMNFCPHYFIANYYYVVVVVYHVTIVAIRHGLLKKFWPIVIGCVLRTAGSLNYEL